MRMDGFIFTRSPNGRECMCMELLRKAKKGLLYLKHYGLSDFVVHLEEKREEAKMPYDSWYQNHKASEETLKSQRQESAFWENAPKISIVTPLYHTPERFLEEMIASVQGQSYENWELCLADGSEGTDLETVVQKAAAEDKRIRYQKLGENLGIAGNTNAALRMAEGDWIAFLDHDDLLAPEALFEAVVRIRAAEKEQPYDMLYTDEDKVDLEGKKHFSPHFKPDWNPELLCSNNYITHFLFVRRTLADKVGAVKTTFDGAQDHDYILRCTEAASHIGHIPKILYHWRCHEASTADNPLSKQYAVDAGVRAVSEHLKRSGINALVEATKNMGFYKVTYPISGQPLVSVICTGETKDFDIRTGYTGIEILSEGDREKVKGEYLLFFDGGLVPQTSDWLERMLGVCELPGVGAVGAKILTSDGKIFHAGIVLGIGVQKLADNVFYGMKENRSGYMHRASLQMDYSAVSGCCLLIRREVYNRVLGVAENLSLPAQMLDLCLKVGKAGGRIVYEPGAVLRLKNETAQKRWNPRTAWKPSDSSYLKEKWEEYFQKADACYNPNFGTEKADYSLAE